MGALLDKPITTKKTEVSPNNASPNTIRYAASGMQGWRTEMEDEHILIESLPSLPNLAIFGVYDGHGGNFTSTYLKQNLLKVLVTRSEFQFYMSLPAQSLRDHEIGLEILKAALIGAYTDVDEEMRRSPLRSHTTTSTRRHSAEHHSSNDKPPMVIKGMPTRPVEKEDKSGSTATLVIITPKHIVCVNAGDSRACMRSSGRTIQLSFDHKPHQDDEQDRIEAAGGYVSMKRVDGDLAVSRALGDFQYKSNANLPPNKQKVSCIPDIVVRNRSPADEFIIIACDGVWDVVSCQECTDMIQRILDEGETDFGLVCEEILDLCLEKQSKDNMTAVFIAFQNIQIASTGYGVAGRRKDRQRKIQEEYEKRRAKDAAKARLKKEADFVRRKLAERARREEEREMREFGDYKNNSDDDDDDNDALSIKSYHSFSSLSRSSKGSVSSKDRKVNIINIAPWA